MSHTQAAAHSSREARQLVRQVTANLRGCAQRGPDHGEDRRVPRRNSYLETDAEAQRWSRIGDGSVRQGLVHVEALLDTAKQLRHQQWRDFPLAEIRERKAEREALAAELVDLAARSPAEVPVGRPAAVRLAIAKLDAWIAEAAARVRRIDVVVLEALLRPLDFVTGRLFPSILAIAAGAGVHTNTVIGALRRLKAAGLISWVRRTTRTGAAGQRGPQLEQTSNGYYFEHRKRMPARTWSRYLQLLTAKMRRLGAVPPGLAEPPAPPTAARLPANADLAATLARVGALLANPNT